LLILSVIMSILLLVPINDRGKDVGPPRTGPRTGREADETAGTATTTFRVAVIIAALSPCWAAAPRLRAWGRVAGP